MYLLLGTFILVLFSFFFINCRRRKKILTKIRAMNSDEKNNMINELVEPFGLSYLASQDIFVSHIDSIQKKSGYHFYLVLYRLPIYFDYENKTWLVEFRKGQYGINTGGEIDIYYADRILNKREINNTSFHSVSDEDMPELSFCLFRKGVRIADVLSRQWWLSAFSMGRFSEPADLFMQASIAFPNQNMVWAFIKSLKNAGYTKEDFCVTLNTVTFFFTGSSPRPRPLCRLRTAIAQYNNRFWYNAYLFITRPFCLSLDRLLYLYYYFPLIFFKMLHMNRYNQLKKQRRHLS